MTDLITETSRHTGLQVADLAEVGRKKSAIILIFDRHKPDKATAVALLPDGRRFVNRALRLDSLEEGHKWDARASRVHFFGYGSDRRPDADVLSPFYGNYFQLVEGKDIGIWYFIGVGEDDKAWQELPEGSSGKRPAIDSKLLRWVEHNLLRFTDVLKAGDQIEVFQNQAYRYGQVVARIGSEILGIFTYKNGRNVLYVWNFGIPESSAPNWGSNPIRYFPQYDAVRSVSFNSIPKKWVDEIANLDLDLDAAHILPVGPDAGTDAEHIINFLEEEFSGEDNTI